MSGPLASGRWQSGAMLPSPVDAALALPGAGRAHLPAGGRALPADLSVPGGSLGGPNAALGAA
jgi:hypothetical protein